MKENLEVVVTEECVWINFNASNGKTATISVNALVNAVNSHVSSSAILQWCEDRRREKL